jgi:hypothetical protein
MIHTINWIDQPAQTVSAPTVRGLPADDPQAAQDALIRAFNAWGQLGHFDASIDEHWTILELMEGK